MGHSIDDDVGRLAAAAARQGIRPRSFLRYHHHLFRGVSLPGRTVLDVGSGGGLTSYYAVARGAGRVVSIEPEASGSEFDALGRARSLRAELSYEHRVEIIPTTVEQSRVAGRFDIVVMNNAINHFNEEACAVLDRDPAAQEAYRPLFERLSKLCKPDGILIVTDCSNRNFLNDIGLVNPIMRCINWRIHQPPEVWAKMFLRFGFCEPRIGWLPMPWMGWVGRVFGTKRAVAYFINSHFRLVLRRAPDPPG